MTQSIEARGTFPRVDDATRLKLAQQTRALDLMNTMPIGSRDGIRHDLSNYAVKQLVHVESQIATAATINGTEQNPTSVAVEVTAPTK